MSMLEKREDVRGRAILVGLCCDSTADFDNSDDDTMAELQELLTTAGGETVLTAMQNRHTPDPRTFIGEGKVQEIRELIQANNIDLVIFDNEGTMEGDLYFDEGVAVAGTAEGFGKNTKISIQLHSGVLTNALLAAYDYEGGDLVYTITYGDRSITDPEYLAPAATQDEAAETQTKTAENGGNTVLYIGVAVAVLAVLAVVVLILKKKKAGEPAKKN